MNAYDKFIKLRFSVSTSDAEIIDYRNSIKELIAERDALVAKLALINDEWIKGNFSRKCISIAALREVIELNPRQCLARFRCGGTWLKDSNVNGGKRQGGE